MFTDMRLLWPAIGASAAVIVCLCGAVNVWRLATLNGRPRSLAGMIETLANQGSDSYPLRLEGTTSIPSVIDEGFSLDRISSDDAVFAFTAVVTRRGRVDQLELLDSPPSTGTASHAAAQAAALEAVLKRREEVAIQPCAGRADAR